MPAKRLAALLIAITLLLATQPAQADSFSIVYSGPIQSTWSYFSPTFVSNASYTFSLTAESDLEAGLSGSNLCRSLDGTPLYHSIFNPFPSLIGNQFNPFGGSFQFSDQVTANDYYEDDTSTGNETITDIDADGNPGPAANVSITWLNGVLAGRSLWINYSYGVAYGSGCQTDPSSTQGLVSS